MRIEKWRLKPLTRLSKGGFAVVYRVGGYHLPGDSADLAYKEFTRDADVQAKSAAAAVAYRDGLSPFDRADLDEHAAWPRALVEEPRGHVTGLLMPLIPQDYFCRMEDPDTGVLGQRPLEMTWLAAGAAQRAAVQLNLQDVSKLERLILLGKLVYVIGRLHKHGWVYGDLSLRNVVFAVNPPRVMLIDCDGAAPLSDTSRRQATTPFWEPPECPPLGTLRLQDDRTDIYKLGLAILRCMTPGKGATTARLPSGLTGALDPQGVTLITRALGADRDQRPQAAELYEYFYRAVAASIRPPEVVAARLRNPFRVRGHDVRIDWDINNATTATVIAGRRRFTVDLSQQPDGCAFQPDESGPVAIEVANRFGNLRVELGDVTLYDLPPFKVDFDRLPTLRLPRLPALPMKALDQVIARAPTVRLPKVPAVPSLDSFGLVKSPKQGAMPAVPLPQLGAAVAQASAAVSTALQAQVNQVGDNVRTAYLASQGHSGTP